MSARKHFDFLIHLLNYMNVTVGSIGQSITILVLKRLVESQDRGTESVLIDILPQQKGISLHQNQVPQKLKLFDFENTEAPA